MDERSKALSNAIQRRMGGLVSDTLKRLKAVEGDRFRMDKGKRPHGRKFKGQIMGRAHIQLLPFTSLLKSCYFWTSNFFISKTEKKYSLCYRFVLRLLSEVTFLFLFLR